MRRNPIIAADLARVLAKTEQLWEPLRNQRIFVTGGSGFFGCWLMDSFEFVNSALTLNASAVVLTRDRRRVLEKLPHLAEAPALALLEGDMRTFAFPAGEFQYVIHAATPANPSDAPLAPEALFDAEIEGTQRVLDFAGSHQTRRLLLTSSGAIYGPQPPELRHIPETYLGAPSTLDRTSAYGQGKRAAEFLCAARSAGGDFESVVARCFAFVGPRLPLDANYAVGNFTRDALAGEAIRVAGDGTPFRSYLYVGDLMIWLWTLLFQGTAGAAYNVGSDADLTIAELAKTVGEVVNPGCKVKVAREPDPLCKPQRYVPSIDKARNELGLEPWIDLREGTRRMAEWNRLTLAS